MRLLVTGASGQLGTYVLDRLVDADHPVIAVGGSTGGTWAGLELKPFDLADFAMLDAFLESVRPTVILHLAAVSRADDAFRDPARAFLVNAEVPSRLARWTARNRARLILTSTDLVFDGCKGSYTEEDVPVPLLEYGRSKRAGEELALSYPGVLVARLSLLYGPGRRGRKTFFDTAMDKMEQGNICYFFADEFRTPLDYATAADVLINLLPRAGLDGLLHVGGPVRMSRFELMRRCAIALDIDSGLIRPNVMSEVAFDEPRPVDVSLDSSRLLTLMPEAFRQVTRGM